mmetsp:Transcript_11089/g.18585  ORF Transcript_11089/g.18585 Transcript_11089/m.18585 type:complete len:101 (-) Transcript_11089:65-367(-)
MEERLNFLSKGVKPRKNKDVMNEVMEELQKEGLFYGDKVRVSKEQADFVGGAEVEPSKDKKKKEKKDKKRKREEVSDVEDSDAEEIAKAEKPKKKKKSKN